jgi:hypothetical protein
MTMQNKSETEEANQKMGEKFKNYSERDSASLHSEAEKANQDIQEQFYGDTKEDNLLPFHIDINNPPIKK